VLRVTLDANEFISALQFDGRAVRLLRMAVDGDIEIAISEPMLDEVMGVLRDKFEWDGYWLHAERERLKGITQQVAPAKPVNVIAHDPPENRVLECAEEAGSDFIITGDKDLLRLGQYAGNRAIRPVPALLRFL
jgi:uncharacterized protein